MLRLLLSLALIVPAPALAQTAERLEQERAEYVRWLSAAPNSPLRAVVQQLVGSGITLGGAGADVPLEGVAEHRLSAAGATLALEGPTGHRAVPRGRPVPLGRYLLVASGPSGRLAITVFDSAARVSKAVTHYPVDPALAFIVRLQPPERSGTVRLLAVDGLEVEATEAGSVLVPLGGGARLMVRRLPAGTGEESDLEIFFRDSTNAAGTYPAGRFVTLVPAADGQYRLDFNRARNPFCAYNSVYPCPAPWRGNSIAAPVAAGERYVSAK
jgi:hypothetical protein